jgi:hypothetical protein
MQRIEQHNFFQDSLRLHDEAQNEMHSTGIQEQKMEKHSFKSCFSWLLGLKPQMLQLKNATENQVTKDLNSSRFSLYCSYTNNCI